ncbi:unnamed protein product [Absidia cylindrospora]
MLNLKDMKTKLDNHGYTHHYKLNKEKELSSEISILDEGHQSLMDPCELLLLNSKMPLCQNIDIVIPEKKRTADRLYQLQQFFAIVGTSMKQQDEATVMDRTNSVSPHPSLHHSYIINDDLRNYRIKEFIQTETTYVESLQAALKYVVEPLTSSHNKSILNTYKCSKIFLNLSILYKVNQAFLYDLNCLAGNDFGAVCSTHTAHFSCYRKYLLEQHEAQNLHTKEMKSNPLYRRFISQAKERPPFKRRRFQDILLEPVQRISRYAMMFKDILRLTPQDHPDFAGLNDACVKVREIATMADDTPTKVATMFLNLYQSVKDCPCSLINPNRSLITFVDAVEIQRDTNKPARTVTLFLFNDKIMVATRPPNQRTSEELNTWKDDSVMPCGIPESRWHANNSSGILSGDGSSSIGNGMSSNILASKKETMKFKGWIDIEQVEIFNGNQEHDDSFLLHTSTPIQPTSERRDSLSSVTFEKYFRKGPRLFSITQQPHSKSISARDFSKAVEETKALARMYNEDDQAYERQWDGMNVYSSIYNVENYKRAKCKNNMTILYMEDSEDLELKELLDNSTTLPWIIAVVQSDVRGFRFHICSRIALPPSHDNSNSNITNNPISYQQSGHHESNQPVDFERVFWNNIIICERKLRSASIFSNIHDRVLRNEIQRKSRSRSVPRPPSLTTISKLFNHGVNLPLSPTSPRSVNTFQVTPGSSKSTPMKNARDRTPLPPPPTSSISASSSKPSSSSNVSQDMSWNDSVLTSCSATHSTISSSTKKTSMLRRFASKSSNALYLSRLKAESTLNASANDLLSQQQEYSQLQHQSRSSTKSNPNKAWNSSADLHHPSSDQAPGTILPRTSSNTRTRSYSFSALSSALQRQSSKHDVPPRPNTCSAIGKYLKKNTVIYF